MLPKVLDKNLLARGFVDDYRSFIWKECYNEAGKIEMYVPANAQNLLFYRSCEFISLMESKRLMLIEKLSIKSSLSTGKWIFIEGRSAEVILAQRVLLKDYSTNDEVENSLRVRELFERIFDDNIRSPLNLLDDPLIPTSWNTRETLLNRKIQRLVDETAEDLILLGDTSVLEEDVEDNFAASYSKGDNLYDIYTNYVKDHHFGMRLVLEERNDVEALYLDFYKGVDHTTNDDDDPESIISNIVFSDEWDNISDTSFDEDTENYRNLAYGDRGTAESILYSRSGTEPKWLERKEVRIDLTNENIPTESSEAKINKLYKQRLVKLLKKSHSKTVKCDGEVDPYGFYKYHEHYDLGDLVEFKDALGYTGITRITEYMFSSDSNGEKSYPTFAIDDTN